jgi:hypothetical protein
MIAQEAVPTTSPLPLPVLLNPPGTPIAADALPSEQRIYDPVTQTGAGYPMIAGTSHATCYFAGGVDWKQTDAWDTPY